MRRVLLVVPGLAGPGESILRDPPPSLRRMVASSSVGRLSQAEPGATPEVELFGLSPGSLDMQPGPITVAALGADPPERSVHFHLSLMGLDEAGLVVRPRGAPSGDIEAVMAMAARLNTKVLTIVAGPGLDHGLVWLDGSIDLGCVTAADLAGGDLDGRLPEGDGEAMLRRLIEDSADLLSSCEANRRRLDEGLPPLNLLWPWGPGFRVRTPNLALLRGEPAWYSSASLRLVGLARLLGERHDPIEDYGRGMQIRFGEMAARFLRRPLNVLVVDAFEKLRARGRFEEAAWLLRRLDDEFIAPLVADADRTNPLRLGIAAPCIEAGLSLTFESPAPVANAVPFDERAADEARLPRRALWEFIESSMRSDWPPP